MSNLLFVAVFATSFTMLARPVFVFCDRRLTRRRLRSELVSCSAPTRSRQHVTHRRTLGTRRPLADIAHRRVAALPSFRDSSMCLDDVARRLRLGQSSVDAFADAVHAHFENNKQCMDAAHEVRRTGDLRSTVGHLANESTGVTRDFAHALRTAHVGRGLSIAGVERAAIAHRDRWVVLEEKRTATAASRYSMNALIVLPMASFVLSPLWGGSTLSAISQSGAVRAGVFVGLVLDITAFVWIRRVSGSIA